MRETTLLTMLLCCGIISGAKPPAAPLGTKAVPPGETTMPQGSSFAPSVSSPTPSGGAGGGGSEGMTEFEKDCLKAHNEYRAKHGVPPLKWNSQLQVDAQKYANHLADMNTTPAPNDEESLNAGSGENLAWLRPDDPSKMPTQCQGPKTQDCVQCRKLVADWYNEESDYDYNTVTSKVGPFLHFTQVVWKETSELGMATATSANTWFTVARYKPRGNMGDENDYIENVPRPQW